MKSSDWDRVPGGPPLPELPDEPQAIENWMSELIRVGDVIETAQGVEEKHYEWRIRDGMLRARFQMEVEVIGIRFIQ